MFTATRELEFCFGHRLKDYDGKCHNVHGHNAKAVITIEAETLDQLGMVVDFVKIKRTIGKWLDDNLDHKMLLGRGDPLIDEFQRLGLPVYITEENPTTENMAKLIFQQCRSLGLPVAEVTMWETPYSYAVYRPEVLQGKK